MKTSDRFARAKAFSATIREKARCLHCGAQPVDFHHDDHAQNKGSRVSALVNRGYPIERIQAEIDRCEALCRRCHMTLDGRLAALIKNRPKNVIVPPKPCVDCGVLTKPTRRGRCWTCYEAIRALGLGCWEDLNR